MKLPHQVIMASLAFALCASAPTLHAQGRLKPLLPFPIAPIVKEAAPPATPVPVASAEEQAETKDVLRSYLAWVKELVHMDRSATNSAIDHALTMVDQLDPGQLTALARYKRSVSMATSNLVYAREIITQRPAPLAASPLSPPAPLLCAVPKLADAPYDTITFGLPASPDTGDVPTGSLVDVAALFHGALSGTRVCDTRSDATTAAGLAIASEVINDLSVIVHDITYEVVVAVGGGNVSLLSLIVDIPAVAVHAALFGVTFCDQSVDSAEIAGSYQRLGTVYTNLCVLQCTTENARSTIVNNDNANTTQILMNLVASKTEIINNDNANKTTIIVNANANTDNIINTINAAKKALADLLLRSQIEANLAGDETAPVAWYLTPTANGGHLDLVRSIVLETINNVTAAGGHVGDARSDLAKGDVAKAAGHFKSAFKNYRDAYRDAADSDDD